ncbi:SseB family protein [Arthrobacter sp. NamB2]|uniref:SseB family protein n=1 Tax=Arthrobacter sp. NamB2 TaxID=2576035 RepID=UPI0010C95746|nr:SseB family protein [Arthrobacter sp. NamB2]TKV27989.1 SseB family protein [Arthrobacter sp. NamB2]
MTGRQLPAHIAAALAGNTADSAGRPWAGRDLSGPDNPLHSFDDDDGAANPQLIAALAGLLAAADEPGAPEKAVLTALKAARVFIPIVAQVARAAETHAGLTADKEADMALVTLTAPDGRKALPVFSSTQALERWHPDARPVAAYAARAALAAVAEDAELMVLDPGADLTFVVRRPALWALAQQVDWTPSYEDRALASLVEVAARGEERILSLALRPAAGVRTRSADGSIASGGGPGPELRMDLQLQGGLSPEEVRDAVSSFRTRLLAIPEFVERVDSLDIKLTR